MIVVKGMGTVTVKPDLIVLTMDLQSADLQYERAMDHAAQQIDKLHAAVQLIGIDKNRMKTVNFSVNPQYENQRNENGTYVRSFMGYQVFHQLKLEIDLDTKLLGEVLGAIAGCGCDPALNIAFTVRDKETVSALLLEDAAKNARKKAEILARASGVSLGKLSAVEYGWQERDMLSPTTLNDAALSPAMLKTRCVPEIQPDDIHLTDWASFSWEII